MLHTKREVRIRASACASSVSFRVALVNSFKISLPHFPHSAKKAIKNIYWPHREGTLLQLIKASEDFKITQRRALRECQVRNKARK